jgi:hypothetical protein
VSKARLFAQDLAPLSGLSWGSSYALSGDASVVLVGAAGQVISGALYGGQDRALNGKVRATCILLSVALDRARSRNSLDVFTNYSICLHHEDGVANLQDAQ